MIPYTKNARWITAGISLSLQKKKKAKTAPDRAAFTLKKDGGDMSHLTPIMINGEAGKITSDLC